MYGSIPIDDDRKVLKAARSKRLSDVSNLTPFRSVGSLRRQRSRQRRGTHAGTFETVLRSERNVPPAYLSRPSAESKSSVGSDSKLVAPSQVKHSLLYNILSSKSLHPLAGIFKRFIALVIVVDLAFFIISTEPQLQDRQRTFYIMEGVTSSIFLVEYIARFIICTESQKYKKRGPFLGRLSYMISTNALVDAFATFPFFLELLIDDLKLPTLTYLRVFRLLRITKTLAYSRAFRSVNRVVYYNSEILYVAILLCAFLILFTSFIMYYLRPPDKMRSPGDSEFDSIPATMYLSALMLSGQGGPTGDLPWYTKSVVLMTSFFSVAMFAIPASMFTWGFEAEAERLAAKSYRRKKGSDIGNSDTSSSSDDDNNNGDSGYWSDEESSVDTSDEEYYKIIAGEDDDTDDEEGKKKETLKVLVSQLSRRLLHVEKSVSVKEDKPPLSRLSTIQSSGINLVDLNSEADGPTLVASIKRLEEKVDATTSKLDRLLKAMEKRGVVLEE